jgi:4-alpha-glucanotransferase
MAEKTTLMIGLHNHQPVGNFDEVMEEAYRTAYVVLLDHLDRHPTVKVCLHYTGCLLEWLDVKHPELLHRIRGVVERGQAEILSGGFFEPILPVLPQEDAIAQFEILTRYVRDTFGYDPRGFWLAERVWEPNVPSLAHRAGLKYTVLDQSHFLSSGIGRDDANGYYMTEDQGVSLAVFPIDYRLRYTIPWEDVPVTFDYLRQKHEENPGRGWTFADDGEKFGSWPETFENIIQTGWFEDFFTQIEENGDWLQTQTFSEFLDANPPSGRAYFPTASYPEMLRWSLPPHVGQRVDDFLESLPESDDTEFVQAGFWRNFMARYPEANAMHKRMIRASRRVREVTGADELLTNEAYRHVLRSQCNCPYWHGVFGGLYLNFLRHATWAEMLEGEALAAPVSGLLVEQEDFDADGQDEVIIESASQVLIFSPHEGATLREWDWRAFQTNLIDTMARRPELYHAKVAEATVKGGAGSADIAGVTMAKSEGLEDALHYDRYNRWCLVDVFPAPGTNLKSFSSVQYTDEGDFATGSHAFTVTSGEDEAALVMTRDGVLTRGNTTWPIRMTKTITIVADTPGMTVKWTVENLSDTPYKGLFGSEWNFGLLAGDADDRYYLIDGKRPTRLPLQSRGKHKGITEVGIVDHWQKADIRLQPDREAGLWRYPIETVSLSEGGYEKTYQASAVFLHWYVTLEPSKPWEVEVAARVLEPTWHKPGE